jgi:myosin heavy subunit
VNIFQRELEIYRAEEVKIPDLHYTDNQDILDAICKKPTGLIPMLDEECRVPRGSWEGYISKITKQFSSNPRLKFKPGAKDFILIHFAGEVRYDPSLFLSKNKVFE